MSHISWKALNICKEGNKYAISWISNECQLFKKYESKLIFVVSLLASFAQLVWRWSPEKMSRVRISVKSNFSSSLWDGARYHERPKFCWGPAMPSIYGQNCGLKTWALSWHHLHRENAKEFLNDRIDLNFRTPWLAFWTEWTRPTTRNSEDCWRDTWQRQTPERNYYDWLFVDC